MVDQKKVDTDTYPINETFSNPGYSWKLTSEFIKALSAAQGEIKAASKNADNPFFKSKYAPLDEVWERWQEVGPKHGLVFTVLPAGRDEHGIFVLPTIMHVSTGYIQGKYYISDMGKTPQSQGSALTYARRYTIQLITGIVAEDDDDGNAASKVYSQPQKAAQPKQQMKITNIGVSEKQRKYIYSLVKELKMEASDVFKFFKGTAETKGHNVPTLKNNKLDWSTVSIDLASSVIELLKEELEIVQRSETEGEQNG